MDAMGLFESSPQMCPRDQHCSRWFEKHMKYCLCGTKDIVSLTVGLISVFSWGVAEIPQIITNYKEKSTEGLSIAFLMTWILGDLLNVFGCMLEPATLPTQYYMAMLYTVTTLTLTSQTIYYRHIYPRLKANKRCCKDETVEKNRQHSNDVDEKVDNTYRFGDRAFASGVSLSSPIPLPASARNGSAEGELYYTSARSLSRSHTPTVGFHIQRRNSSVYERSSLEDPLLFEHVPTRSAPPLKIKTMLCVVSAVTLIFSTSSFQYAKSSRFDVVFEKPNQGFVMQVGRKLLQANGSLLQETGNSETSGIGSYLGWGMAAIYMGGRLPQIFLNIKRGHVQGLNPLMFIFALVGNLTYVASILVSSMEWSKIRPNLPWLVDAGGCVILDSFVSLDYCVVIIDNNVIYV